MLKYLPLLVLAACASEGNTIAGDWEIGDGGLFDSEPGACVGSLSGVRITVLSGGKQVAADHVSCDDGGFEIGIPSDLTSATVEVQDGWSDVQTYEVKSIDGDVDLGTIYFDHFGDSD